MRTIMEITDFNIPNCMQHYKKKIKTKNYIKHTYILQDIGSSSIIVSEWKTGIKQERDSKEQLLWVIPKDSSIT
jgi:hypothetical protein